MLSAMQVTVRESVGDSVRTTYNSKGHQDVLTKSLTEALRISGVVSKPARPSAKQARQASQADRAVTQGILDTCLAPEVERAMKVIFLGLYIYP